MRGAAVILALLAGACVEGGGGPEPIKWDRDACHECTMVISDSTRAAEIRSPKGEVFKFDDVGCAALWLNKQPWGKEPGGFWVARAADSKWIDARTAHYLGGKGSPMGYGFAAQDAAAGAVDFEAVQRQALAATQPHAGGMTR